MEIVVEIKNYQFIVTDLFCITGPNHVYTKYYFVIYIVTCHLDRYNLIWTGRNITGWVKKLEQ